MKDAIKELLPPDLPPIVRWRLAVFLVCVTFLLFMMWAVSPYGFALASEYRSVRGNVDEILVRQTSQDLFEAKRSECEATNTGARLFFQARVFTLSREYSRLARSPAVIPPCLDGPAGPQANGP